MIVKPPMKTGLFLTFWVVLFPFLRGISHRSDSYFRPGMLSYIGELGGLSTNDEKGENVAKQ